ncbi:hypothetical protein LCGC14_2840520, partial [marine sediment metagenome]
MARRYGGKFSPTDIPEVAAKDSKPRPEQGWSGKRRTRAGGRVNALFLAPQYAETAQHGAALCPPSGWLALYFASLGPWPAVFEPLLPIVPTP